MAEHEVTLQWEATKDTGRNDVQAVVITFERAAYSLSGAQSGSVLIDAEVIWSWNLGSVSSMRGKVASREGAVAVTLAWVDGHRCEDNVRVITEAAERQIILLPPGAVLLVQGKQSA